MEMDFCVVFCGRGVKMLNGYVTNPTPTLTPNLNPNSNPNRINKKIQKETTLQNR
jgi:hypothetical protein